MIKMIVKNCIHSGFFRGAGLDLIVKVGGDMVYCLQLKQSEAMKTDKALDADHREGGYVPKPRPGYMIVVDCNYLYGSVMVS